jgi:Icc-related predicted phosphoesterase
MAVDVDVVIGAGDFANRHQGLAETLDLLAAIDKPSVLVPGNGETEDELRDAVAAASWTSARVLHGDGCQIEVAGFGTVDFWGVGGGIPVTPFGDWSYDFDEATGEELLAGCPTGGVLVVHSPPIDTVDHDSSGQIRGSEAIRQAVQSKSPRLVVCGHIHSDWGKQVTLGRSRIVNAGPRGQVLTLS